MCVWMCGSCVMIIQTLLPLNIAFGCERHKMSLRTWCDICFLNASSVHNVLLSYTSPSSSDSSKINTIVVRTGWTLAMESVFFGCAVFFFFFKQPPLIFPTANERETVPAHHLTTCVVHRLYTEAHFKYMFWCFFYRTIFAHVHRLYITFIYSSIFLEHRQWVSHVSYRSIVCSLRTQHNLCTMCLWNKGQPDWLT